MNGLPSQLADEIIQAVRGLKQGLEDLSRSTRTAGSALFQAAAPVVGNVVTAAGGVVASQVNATGAAFQAAGAAAANGAGLGGVAGAFMGGGVPGFVAGSIADSFLVNSTLSAARHFGRDVGVGVAQDFARFGFGDGGVNFGTSVAGNALRAGSNLPILGDIFAEVQDPIQNAGGRVKGVVGALARAGVPQAELDKLSANLVGQFLPEEIRAKQAELGVDRALRDAGVIGTAVEGSENFQRLLENAQRLSDVFEALSASFGSFMTLVRGFGGLR